MSGRVVDIAYEGGRSLYRVATERYGTVLVSAANVTRTQDGAFQRGTDVWLGWDDSAAQVLDE